MPITLSPNYTSWLGLLPLSASPGTTQLNAAATYYALSFVAMGKTLNAVRAFISAVTGTLGASDIVADLYDSAGGSGFPGASIETGKTPSSTVTASGWYDFTGFTTSLAAGQMYWIVFRNVTATPASNNCTFRQLTNPASGAYIGAANTRFQWSQASSTNSGVSWSVNANRSALRVAYSDSTYSGIPLSNAATAGVGDGVYSTRESGVVFTSPSNAALNVVGLAMLTTAKTGSPTGNPRLGLWTGSTPSNQGYTDAIPAAGVTTTQWIYAPFSAAIQIPAGSVVRVTLGETTQSDASGQRWNNPEFTRDTDSNSLGLLPFGSTLKKTYYDGSSWTDTQGSVFGFALILDPAGEFGSSGGGVSGSRIFGGF